MFSSIAICADAPGIVIYALENRAGLTDGESSVLSDVVQSVFKESKINVNVRTSVVPVSETCSGETCALQDARANGDIQLVIGTITKFDDSYVLRLKLFDAQTGDQLASENTSPTSDLKAMLSVAATAASNLETTLRTAIPEKKPSTQESPHENPTGALDTHHPLGNAGVLEINTEPAGAFVVVSREKWGSAPVKKKVVPHVYRIAATAPGRKEAEAVVRVGPGEIESVDLQLDYKASPYKIAGHALFWSGVALTSLGIIGVVGITSIDSMIRITPDGREEYIEQEPRREDIVMAVSGFVGAAVLISAGITLWVISPGDRAYWDNKYPSLAAPEVAIGPGSVSLSGSF